MPRLTWEEYRQQENVYLGMTPRPEHGWTQELIDRRVSEMDESLHQLWEKSTPYLCFCQSLIPCPTELNVQGDQLPYDEQRRRVALYGAVDWYRWCINNWGTKWGDFQTKVVKDRCKQTVIKFESAWSPPTEALLTISKMFPKLKFHLRAKEEDCKAWAYGIQNGRMLYERLYRYR